MKEMTVDDALRQTVNNTNITIGRFTFDKLRSEMGIKCAPKRPHKPFQSGLAILKKQFLEPANEQVVTQQV